jgi:hypothetical protein
MLDTETLLWLRELQQQFAGIKAPDLYCSFTADDCYDGAILKDFTDEDGTVTLTVARVECEADAIDICDAVNAIPRLLTVIDQLRLETERHAAAESHGER